MMKRRNQQGFTLVEMSIVILIIGLLIAGMMTYKTLMESARIRRAVSRYNELQAAVTTFRLKFNGLPGDITQRSANGFGFTRNTGSSCSYGGNYGNGNGIIEYLTSSPPSPCPLYGEVLQFWADLGMAKLLNITSDMPNATWLLSTYSNEKMDRLLLPAMIDKTAYYTVYSSNGINYYQISGNIALGGNQIGNSSYLNVAGAFTPMQAYNFDVKIDDGDPRNGAIVAVEGSAMNTIAVASATGCVGADNVTYNTAYSTNPRNCQLRIKMQ